MNIKTPEVLTHGGVPLMAEATAQVKIESSDHSIHIAEEQFLGLGKEGIKDVSMTILEGKMREALAQMPEVVKSLTGVDLQKYLKEKLTPEEKKKKISHL